MLSNSYRMLWKRWVKLKYRRKGILRASAAIRIGTILAQFIHGQFYPTLDIRQMNGGGG